MPRSLATGKRKVTLLSTKPANLKAPTVAELEDGIDASCRIVAGAFTLAPTASETVSEGSLCDTSIPEVFTTAKAEGSFTIFRYFNDGQAETALQDTEDGVGDSVYQALKTRGTRLWIATRFTDKKSTEAWEAGDEVSVFEVTTDYPRAAEAEGYIKAEVTLSVGTFEVDGTVAT